jgi:hypothetical protein
MNIDDQVNAIVQNIIDDITSKVQLQVAAQIDAKISDILNNLDTTSVLANQLSLKIDDKLRQLPIDAKSIESQLSSRLESMSSSLATDIQQKSTSAINEAISLQISKLDFGLLCQSTLINAIQNQSMVYPAGSINSDALNIENLTITGDHVVGGIIKNFGSTGIDDKASQCQLSIFDETTVVENNLLTKDLTVKGTVNVEGNLNVTGSVAENSPFYVTLVRDTTNNVRSSLNAVVFDSYADMVFNKIKDDGLDLTKLTFNGQLIIDGQALNNTITSSNLQKVGQLKELQVSGETFLAETLYISNKRTGINTIEPNQALSVWDQEVEIGMGKLSSGTAIMGTPRPQTLVLSSNGKNNLTLNTDGSVSVDTLGLGQISISSSLTPPSDDRPLGCIVFNANPTLGGPIGWVSLGSARWANFGIID